jgi:hypothetical protein
MSYPFDIPSIFQKHPLLSKNPHLNVFGVLLNASKEANAPIDPLAVIHAEEAVELLLALKGGSCCTSPCLHVSLTYCLAANPGVISDAVVETAKNRSYVLRAIRESHLLSI